MIQKQKLSCPYNITYTNQTSHALTHVSEQSPP